jgi:hypothetical protein
MSVAFLPIYLLELEDDIGSATGLLPKREELINLTAKLPVLTL